MTQSNIGITVNGTTNTCDLRIPGSADAMQKVIFSNASDNLADCMAQYSSYLASGDTSGAAAILLAMWKGCEKACHALADLNSKAALFGYIQAGGKRPTTSAGANALALALMPNGFATPESITSAVEAFKRGDFGPCEEFVISGSGPASN